MSEPAVLELIIKGEDGVERVSITSNLADQIEQFMRGGLPAWANTFKDEETGQVIHIDLGSFALVNIVRGETELPS